MNFTKRKIPTPTIERAVLYKRILSDCQASGMKTVFSHELAELAQNTPAQVRRDIMLLGYESSSQRGYDIAILIEHLTRLLHGREDRAIALVGIGNIGRALISYFSNREVYGTIVAAFDNDPKKENLIIAGCPCYHTDSFESVVEELGVSTGIITVPAGQAQLVADRMVRAGITGILNFAPVILNLPDHVICERIDIASSLEKLFYFMGH